MAGVVIGVALAVVTPSAAFGGGVVAGGVPRMLAAIGVEERVGAQVPLDTRFTAAGLGPIALRDVVDGKRPVLLVLAYARCAMLCSLVLRGVADVARKMTLVPGEDYRLVLIGLDPRETIHEATRLQASLLEQLGRGGDAKRWPYLVGPRASVDAVANALGFRYAWDPRTEQYAHAAVAFVLTPDGRVARYLHGLQFAPDEVTTALTEAAAGRTLSTAAAEILRCFRFDPSGNKLGARAQRMLQIGAALIFLLLLAAIVLLIVWERRRTTTRSEP